MPIKPYSKSNKLATEDVLAGWLPLKILPSEIYSAETLKAEEYRSKKKIKRKKGRQKIYLYKREEI